MANTETEGRPFVAELGVDHPAVSALGRDYAEAIQDKEVLASVIMMMIRTRFIDDSLTRGPIV